MFKETYQNQMEHITLQKGQQERIVQAMTQGKAAPHRAGVRAGRTALAVVALSLLLLVSALAVSPTLRDTLTQVLGGFSPYAQSMNEAICVENGVEIRVLSALADGSMVKVYAQATDLQGDRLTADMQLTGLIDRESAEDMPNSDGVNTTTGGGKCVGFDEETGTALLEIVTYGSFPTDLAGMRLLIFDLYPNGFAMGDCIQGDNYWEVPLTVETLESRTIPLVGVIGQQLELQQATISAIGVTLISGGESILSNYDLTITMEDGSTLHPKWEGGGSTGFVNRITCWEFSEPIAPEDVAAITIGKWCIPLQNDTALPGYWLE